MADFYTPQDVSLLDVKISNTVNKTLDITDLVSEFNIYEELGQPVLLADMSIIDSTGVLGDFPITGQEVITCTVQRIEVIHDLVFRVVDINGLQNQGQQVLTYTLDLVEGSYFNNMLSLVSQAYEGNISDIIASIYEDYLKTELNHKDQSTGSYKCIIPNWKPYTAIEWLMKRAVDKKGYPLVLTNTFQNGTSLLSLETIFSRKMIEEFTYHQQSNNEGYDYNSLAKTPLEFTNVNNGGVLSQLRNGAFGSTYINVNTNGKYATHFEYDLENYHEDQPKLQQNVIINHKALIDGKQLNHFPKTIQAIKFNSGDNFGPSHKNYDTSTNDILPFRNNFNNMLQTFKYNLGIHGRSDIEVGCLVSLKFPSNRPYNPEDPESGLDKKRSGRHLVTKVRHKINDRDKYVMLIECVSDGLGEDYNAK